MRVLTLYYKSTGGGYLKRLCRLIAACSRDGMEVHYLAPAPFPALPSDPRVTWHRAWIAGPEWLRRLLALLILPIQSLCLCVSAHIDCIAVFGTFYATVCALAAALCRRPIVTFLRGYWLEEIQWRGAGPAEIAVSRLMNRMGYRVSRLVVANSESLKDMLAADGVAASKIRVLPNEVPSVSVDRAEARRRLAGMCGLPPDAAVLSFVGTFKAMKQAWMAVDIVAGLQDRKAWLVFAGEGADRERIERRIHELNVADRCRMLGWVADPAFVYAASDVTLLCSAFEGSPNAILESLACGTPVVAARVRGVADILPPELCWEPGKVDDAVRVVARVLDGAAEVRAVVDETRRRFTFDWDARVVELVGAAAAGVPSRSEADPCAHTQS